MLKLNESFLGSLVAGLTVSALVLMIPSLAAAEMLWIGDYRDGSFRQWHSHDDRNTVHFFQIKPAYGRPIQYGGQLDDHVGDGQLLSLVASTERTVNGIHYPKGPTRGPSEYAARFVVKNSSNGSEPVDCDGDATCDKRRRTELTVQSTLADYYDAIPNQSERWLSISHYIPADWEDAGSGFGPMLFQVKPVPDGGGIGPCLTIEAGGGEWQIQHRWSDVLDRDGAPPYQQRPVYSSKFPVSGDKSGDLLADFPDVSTSRAALADLNKGGWTDWVMHVIFDHRGAKDGGKGLLEVWKRADSGPWIKVLNVKPGVVTVDGATYDRGICYNTSRGFGLKAGMYMGKDQVWGLKSNRVMYNANMKLGDASTAFEEMSPDGSSPFTAAVDADDSPPKPPTLSSE